MREAYRFALDPHTDKWFYGLGPDGRTRVVKSAHEEALRAAQRKASAVDERTAHSELILRHLQAGESVTAADAVSRWSCYRLGARIFDLRRAGHDIETEMVSSTNGKRYARYHLKATDGEG
jgi:hypothetical protein